MNTKYIVYRTHIYIKSYEVVSDYYRNSFTPTGSRVCINEQEELTVAEMEFTSDREFKIKDEIAAKSGEPYLIVNIVHNPTKGVVELYAADKVIHHDNEKRIEALTQALHKSNRSIHILKMEIDTFKKQAETKQKKRKFLMFCRDIKYRL